MKTIPAEEIIFSYMLIKLASRCNIACTYCYWFEDGSVYQLPKIMKPDVEEAFIKKLETYLKKYPFERFSLIFHGGEPLLFGKKRFISFCEKLIAMTKNLNTRLDFAITTNAILIDQEWAEILKRFEVKVSVSLDGTEEMHDARRIDFKDKGTYARVLNGIQHLKQAQVNHNLLAVCTPSADPNELLHQFVDVLDIKYFDVLMPDATHDKPPTESLAEYYIKLFNTWYDHYSKDKVDIVIIRSIVKGLLGKKTLSQTLGWGYTDTVSLLPDGSFEGLDVVRITGENLATSKYNVFEHEIEDIRQDPNWRKIFESSQKLAPACQSCRYQQACGGGPIQMRWSQANEYDNPSVYCQDIQKILDSASEKIAADLYIEKT